VFATCLLSSDRQPVHARRWANPPSPARHLGLAPGTARTRAARHVHVPFPRPLCRPPTAAL